MNKILKNNKNVLYFLGINLIFLIISILFYSPLLEGKKLLQSDIQQYRGMSKQLKEFRDDGKEIYWVDNAFSGMPTYLLGAKYPLDFLGAINSKVRIFMHPASVLFLYLFGAFTFLYILKIPYRYAILGALAYGFSTYLLIILQVGHNTKALALAYMPLFLGGAYLIFQNKFLKGFLLATLFLGLQIKANHYQITYYTFLLLLIFCIVNAYKAFKENQQKVFFKQLAILCASGIFALGLNATQILATAEYSKHSIRGASQLEKNFDGSIKEKTRGLDYEYITQYSYGIFESLNLLVPRVQGGGSREDVGKKSETYTFLTQNGVPNSQAKGFTKNLPTYWGTQPILEAPAYIGISVFFLALLAFFILKGVNKIWLTIGVVFSLLLSWGDNLGFLTQFFIQYFPLYSKFRAVSSIQVVLELCVPILATFGIYHFLEKENAQKLKYLLRTSYILLGGMILLLLFKSTFSFQGGSDSYIQQYYGDELLEVIIEDRKRIFTQDILRATLIIFGIAISLFLFIKQKLKRNYVYFIVLGIVFIDLLSIANRYIDNDLFIHNRRIKNTFNQTEADKQILKDTTQRYRVFEVQGGLNSARSSYFHNSIGGYHGAKLRNYQELYDYLGYHNQTDKLLNILNTKYILYSGENGGTEVMGNENVLGNAWIVDSLVGATSYDDYLSKIRENELKHKAILLTKDFERIPQSMFKKDTLANIELVKHSPIKLDYKFNSSENQFVVFSEVYYKDGWKAFIDGEEAPYFNTNYILRGLFVPKGNHNISFVFEPKVIRLGTNLKISFLVILAVLISGLIFFQYKKRR